MGVDTEIAIKTNRPYSVDELVRLQWRLREAIGGDKHLGFSSEGQMISVFNLQRWYGDGYERGNWPTIYAILRWCMANFDGVVYCWPDHSEMDSCNVVTHEWLETQWAHWCRVGHEPYFGNERGAQCCGTPIYVNGWRGRERLGYCPSCGLHYETTAGVWTKIAESK